MRRKKLALGVLIALVVLNSPVMDLNAQVDILPGWTMYFIDYDRSRDLELKVTQREPGELPEGAEWSKYAPATGFGNFDAANIKGCLFVTEASWSNYAISGGNWSEIANFPEEGFPESANIKGTARLGFLKWVPFEVKFISHCYPGFPLWGDRDVAILHLDLGGDDEVDITFTGELHHGRLRALLKPSDELTEPLAEEPMGNSLGLAYPNPANPSTEISYSISRPGQVTLKVYNILGQVVRTLVHEAQDAGVYTIRWDGKGDRGEEVASGVYLYQLRAGTYVETKRMIMIK